MSLEVFSHLLDYRHKKVSDKLYKRAIGGLHVTARRRRKGLIQEAKVLVVKEVVLLVASPLRRTSTEAVRKITSGYIC